MDRSTRMSVWVAMTLLVAAVAAQPTWADSVTIPYQADFSVAEMFTETSNDGQNEDADDEPIQVSMTVNTDTPAYEVHLIADNSQKRYDLYPEDKKETANGTALVEAADAALRTDGFLQTMTFDQITDPRANNRVIVTAFDDIQPENPNDFNGITAVLELNRDRIILAGQQYNLFETVFDYGLTYSLVFEGIADGQGSMDVFLSLEYTSDEGSGFLPLEHNGTKEVFNEGISEVATIPAEGNYFGFGAWSQQGFDATRPERDGLKFDVTAYALGLPGGDEMLAGDANGDGQVDGNDLISVEENFGDTGDPGIPGDANGDGQVDGNDLISVEENFGATSGAASVPEPSSMILLGLCGAALLRTRR